MNGKELSLGTYMKEPKMNIFPCHMTPCEWLHYVTQFKKKFIVKKFYILKKERKKMREKYETPEMEIVEFETEDIITASGDADASINSLPKIEIY